MIEISDYIDVREKAEELNCNIPNSVAILPRNFETATSREELLHEETAPSIRVILNKADVTETPLENEGEQFSYAVEQSFEWVGPAVFFSASYIVENPHVINIACGMIANYLTDIFRGRPKHLRNAKLSFVIEKENGECKEIKYNGPPEGLEDLPNIIRELQNETGD